MQLLIFISEALNLGKEAIDFILFFMTVYLSRFLKRLRWSSDQTSSISTADMEIFLLEQIFGLMCWWCLLYSLVQCCLMLVALSHLYSHLSLIRGCFERVIQYCFLIFFWSYGMKVLLPFAAPINLSTLLSLANRNL